MHARVTAIVVARNGAAFLESTLAGIRAQTRRPDTLVLVDAGSTDASAAMLADAQPTTFVSARARHFGTAVGEALGSISPAESDDEWLWLLAHDNAPAPGALAALLGAVEIAPSVAVAGPKLMRWEQPDVIESFGESITPFGASVQLVTDELDQAQHDRRSDLMAVAAGGMLVRRRVFSAVGGFDPGLPDVDAALDLCVRIRLAGHRVVTVPEARVATLSGPEHFGRAQLTRGLRARHRRAAQLHRRLVWSPPLALPLHWLSLVPLALLRSLLHVAAKRAWAIPGEFGAAFATAFGGGVPAARRMLGRNRMLGWRSVAPLRVPSREARDLLARREPVDGRRERTEVVEIARPGFFTAGGAWVAIALLGIGTIAHLPFLGAAALEGGGLLPLSPDLASLWSNVGYGWRDAGPGFAGAADPFTLVLAVLGTLAFWAPSSAIVGLWTLALPIAGISAWAFAARFAARGWAPAVAAVLWALAPPFLAALAEGRIGAVVAHILLPFLGLALVNAARSWPAAGAAAVLFALVAASAPVLLLVLLPALVAWMVANPRSIHRLLVVLVPVTVLFVPLILQRAASATLPGLLADPGPAVVGTAAPAWQLALGAVEPGMLGWTALAGAVGLPTEGAVILVAVLLAPVALMALLALFLPGVARVIPALSVSLVAFVIAVLVANLTVTTTGPVPVAVWPGSALSVYWLGIVIAAVAVIEALRRRAAAVALPAILAALVVATPLVIAPLTGTSVVEAGTGRVLPALVTAEAETTPRTGTLELVPQQDGSILARLHRGVGTTLDEQSTLAAVEGTAATREEIVDLAGNLSARSGFAAGEALQEAGIGFVVVADAREGAAATARTRAADALDSTPELVAVGQTADGYLWRLDGFNEDALPAEPTTPFATTLDRALLAIAFGLALLIAVPTGGRRRPVAAPEGEENPADTFEEDENA